MITQAVIMCGGLGTRAGLPYPKVLAPLGQETLLDHHIKLLWSHGLRGIMVLAGNQGEKVSGHLCFTYPGYPEIAFRHDRAMQGTGYALLQVEQELHDNFLVLYGDIATTMNLSKLLDYHMAGNAALTQVVHESTHPLDATPFDAMESGYRMLSGSGIYVMKRECAALAEEGDDISRHLVPKLLRRKRKVLAYVTDEFILDTGTPERLAEAQAKL